MPPGANRPLPELYDCFLSYTSADVAQAKQIHDRLTAAGFKVWWDKAYLESGMRWHEEIERHCDNSRVILPLLTPEWQLSTWTRYETYGAEHIIPLRLRGEWEEIATPPLALYQRDTLDLENATDQDWDRFFAHLRRYLDQPRADRNDTRRRTLLRHRPIDHFVGRDQDLVDIHEKLFLNRLTALTHGSVLTIHALGGVGKTTLARHYAEHFWRAYPHICWLDCRNGIEAGFAEIYDLLNPGKEQAVPLDVRAKRAKQHLEQHNIDQTLLILDNAEDEAAILDWIPSSGDCHVLITSRFAGWSKGIETHPVWVLKPEPARKLLQTRSGRTGEDEAADALASKLQYLPLALEQAAAYLAEQTDIDFAAYLEKYEANEKLYLDQRTRGATDYPDSVYLTWRTTLEKLPEGARAMLRLHAFYAPTPFPIDIYLKGATQLAEEIEAAKSQSTDYISASSHPTAPPPPSALPNHMPGSDASLYLSPPTSDSDIQSVVRGVASTGAASSTLYRTPEQDPTGTQPPDEHTIRAWKTALTKYSMANPEPNGAISVHALVQTVERHTLGDRAQEVAARAAALYFQATPNPSWEPANRTLWATLVSHSRALATSELTPGQLCGNLFAELTMVFHYAGDWKQGIEAARQTLASNQRAFGPEHPNTLSSLNNLAALLRSQGDYAAAEPLYRQALEASQRVLGPNHPNTLATLNNLAGLLESQGDSPAAEPLYRQALEARQRVLGPEHPDTLTSLNNLAGILHSQGDYPAAEPLFRQALEGATKTLGPNHPNTQIFAANHQSCLDAIRSANSEAME